MNIHHLELFYYVAKHGGIAAAVRKMPYGIQQPAVSGQIGRLEEALGQPGEQIVQLAVSRADIALLSPEAYAVADRREFPAQVAHRGIAAGTEYFQPEFGVAC